MEGRTAASAVTVRNAYFEALLHSLICALVAGFRRPQVVHIHGIGPAPVVPLLRILVCELSSPTMARTTTV